MFTPRVCPHADCAMHHAPDRRFFRRYGYYRAKCRPHPVPRFRCNACERTFSRQTFRMDYRDHRPDLNKQVFEMLCSGAGLRQAARVLGMRADNLANKFRKIGRHCERLNRNVLAQLPLEAILQLDEFETYETRRSTRPVTLPVLIERVSRYIVAACSAPIRPSGTMTKRRIAAIAADEQRLGRRKSRSRAAVMCILKIGAGCCADLRSVVLETDEKPSYPRLAKRAFGDRLVHLTTPGRIARGTWNPLFAINHTEEVGRDLVGRLRRKSWLVSKKRRFLDNHLAIYVAYRNLVRNRFNHDDKTPAELLGWMRRGLEIGEVLGWRQDFGGRSAHPLSRTGRAIRSGR